MCLVLNTGTRKQGFSSSMSSLKLTRPPTISVLLLDPPPATDGPMLLEDRLPFYLLYLLFLSVSLPSFSLLFDLDFPLSFFSIYPNIYFC